MRRVFNTLSPEKQNSSKRRHLVLALNDDGLLRDVEAIEELADVLVLDGGGLLDEGGGLGDRVNVVS